MEDVLLRGIAELRRFLGDAAYQLQNANPKSSEAAAFHLVLPPDYEGINRTLRIAFPKEFPNLTLDFSISPTAVQIWPHVMRYGVCLYGPNQIPATSTPEEAVNSAMTRLWQLIAFSLEGSDPYIREAEFAREVRSYWVSQMKQSPNRFSLVKLPTTSCPLFVVSANTSNPFKSNQYIGAEKYEDISDFESRYKRSLSKQKGTAKPAYFVKLNSTPSNLIDENLLNWLEPHIDPAEFFEFKKWFDQSSDLPMRWVILSLPTEVVALQGFVLTEPNVDLTKRHATLYGRKTTKRKFYASKVKLNIRFAPIDVLDAAVIHQRAGKAASGLSTKKVVLVGAGSLGGEVAELLARSGVGHIYIIDYDTLEDVNIGRHTLGATDLGKYKAEALADRISMNVPTANVKYSNEILQRGGRAHAQALLEADMVIVTTASWGSEACLWDLKSGGAKWSLIQAWSEPHGIVGHILTTPLNGNYDARYLFEDGRFVNKMSEWPEGGVYALPACGGSYIPGGPVVLAKIAGQTVQKALDQLIKPKETPEWHVLVGDPKKITEYGGTYKGPILPESIESCEFSYPWPKREK